MSVHFPAHHGLGDFFKLPGTPLSGQDEAGETFHRVMRTVLFVLILVAMFVLL